MRKIKKTLVVMVAFIEVYQKVNGVPKHRVE
ncbi:hypothetical protein A5880_002789 [Enterococcus sp. 4G2_DIV0659]|uniref:Uncharacterized protein n=1 Tax=Candidatus Enterococcus mansonii TaxID=1834181 RepID=A0A242CID1_9ENTE|nr:hypothetical protein A5880_000686 [Enterococcus sp. 4G2_DIV0659]